jgi:hypothetical protein
MAGIKTTTFHLVAFLTFIVVVEFATSDQVQVFSISIFHKKFSDAHKS